MTFRDGEQVDHDISLLVPEVWSRMREEERSAKYLLEHGSLPHTPNPHPWP